MLEEKAEKIKQYKKIVKNSRAVQCLHCSRYISCNIFLQHLSDCNSTNGTGTQPVLAHQYASNNPYLLDLNSLEITINQTIVKESSDSRPYTEYLIQMSHKGRRWAVSRKYKEFCELHQRLCAEYPSTKFPDSSYVILGVINTLSNGKRPTVIEDRRKALQQYLRDLSQMEKIATSQYYQQFLDLDKNPSTDADESVIIPSPHVLSSKGYNSNMSQSDRSSILQSKKTEEGFESLNNQSLVRLDSEKTEGDATPQHKKQFSIQHSPFGESKSWRAAPNKENTTLKYYYICID